jgi:enoyl-CoA hydratase
MTDQIVFTRNDDGTAEILLNRPEKLNAITLDMTRAIRDLRRRINEDDDIRAVVVHGAGERAFCAGTDLASIEEAYPTAWAFRNRICYATEFRRIRKPTVAAIKGWCLGGGLEIAINCDIRVADQTAMMGAPEVKHGWLGGGGQTLMLTRLVGYGQASLLCMTGDPVDAATAERIGLVQRLVPQGEEVAAARDIARRIARHSTIAVITVKDGIRASLSGTLEPASRHENDLMIMAFAMGNQTEGIARFKDRKG